MLNINKASQYGLRAVIYLSNPKIRYTTSSIQYIAKREEIPVAYLRKLVVDLKRAGIVRTIQGQYGGIQLAKDPAAISVLDILNAAGEEVQLNECVPKPFVCKQSKGCSIRPIWVEVTFSLRDYFDSTSIADVLEQQELCEKESSRETNSKNYAINE